MTNTKLLGFVAIGFLAGTIASGTVAFADKDPKSPFDVIVTAINNLTTAINNKQTTVTVNAPAGPPGPAGPAGAQGSAGPQGTQGPPGSAGSTVSLYQVGASGTLGAGQFGGNVALCNPGDLVTGGGYNLPSGGTVSDVKVNINNQYSTPPPNNQQQGWNVEGFNAGSGSEDIDVHAICEHIS